MKVIKSFGKDNLFVMGEPSDEHFKLIKTILPSDDIKKEDLFTYKVILCDNMVDRDIEMFSHNALQQITDKFIGVIGIADHNPTIKNNHSRIYMTELNTDERKQNDFGDAYESVIAYAYTLNNDKNKDFIQEIKSGLLKEVSIGFDNFKRTCSVCGNTLYSGECVHCLGQVYEIDGKDIKCVGVIDTINDAYEWSFVSIPAQRKAGVTKQFDKEGKPMATIKELSLEIAPKLEGDLAVKFMKAVKDLDVPESEVVKSLNAEITTLKRNLAAKDAEIKTMKQASMDKAREDAIEEMFKELSPKNDLLRELALREVEDLITVGEDGTVTGIEEAKTKLSATEYEPLFDKQSPTGGTGDGEKTVGEEDEKPDDKEEDTTKSKSGAGEYKDESMMFSAKNNQLKKLDFTKISGGSIKSNNTVYTSKGAGIRTVDN